MQRWHVTLGLSGLVVAAAALAPRLFGAPAVPHPVPHPLPPVPSPVSVVDPVPPTGAGHLVLDAGLDKSAVLAGASSERFVVITVTAPEDLGKSVRRPVDVAVAMDVSGSMTGEGKIDYAKKAARYLLDRMTSEDRYALVTFSDDAQVRIPSGSVAEDNAYAFAIDRIHEGGGTNLGDGLRLAAREALDGSNGENAPRVVLLSDGNPTVGVQDPDALARQVADLHAKGVTVSVVGLGLDYNEDLLQRLADVGGGSYDFVDDPLQLATVFQEELQRSQSVVARGTQVTVSWDRRAGIEVLDVVGYDEQTWIADCAADLCETGFTVDMGEVYAGQTRKIVARVRVDAPSAEERWNVARVALAYDDVVDGSRGYATVVPTATSTRDVALVDGSIDRTRTKHAALAWGNEQTQLAARAFAAGNIAEAEDYAQKGESWFAFNAGLLGGDGDLADRAQRAQDLRTVMPTLKPSAPEGRRAVMQAKEDYVLDAR